MTGINHAIDDAEERAAVLLKKCLDRFVKQNAIRDTELGNSVGIRDTFGSRARDDLAQNRHAVAHAALARACHERKCLGVRSHSFTFAHLCQVLLQQSNRHKAKRVVMSARPDGRQNLVRLGRRENESHMRRWFLDEFEQRVEARIRNHVGFVDDENLVPRCHRREHRTLTQLASVLDLAVRGRIELDDIDGAGTVGREVEAALAHTAGIGSGALLAVERTGDDAGSRRLATTARTGEEVGVVHAVVLQSPAQWTGHVVLPHDLGQCGRAVGAIQGHGHRSTLDACPDRAVSEEQGKKGTPRAPARARLPLLPSGPGGVHLVTPHEGSA